MGQAATRSFSISKQVVRWGVLTAMVGTLAACSQARLAVHMAKEVGAVTNPVDEGTYKVGNPYQIKRQWYYPAVDPDYDETGIASWYGPNFHGKPTANGATFDQWAVTAAHKTLPMPTQVRVTNLENGRSLVVTINDRGPFVDNRIIDLSRQSARLLGMEEAGLARVRVQALTATGEDEFITPTPVASEPLPEISASPTGDVVSGELLPPPGVEASQPVAETAAPPRVVESAPTEQIVASSATTQTVVSVQPVTPTQMYIQAGAFTVTENATELGKTLSVFGQTQITPVDVNGQTFYRVRVGPVNDIAEADRLLARIQDSGVENARLVIEELN